MCDEPTISPYLRRPLRSYEQVLREQEGKRHGAPRAASRIGKTVETGGVTARAPEIKSPADSGGEAGLKGRESCVGKRRDNTWPVLSRMMAKRLGGQDFPFGAVRNRSGVSQFEKESVLS